MKRQTAHQLLDPLVPPHVALPDGLSHCRADELLHSLHPDVMEQTCNGILVAAAHLLLGRAVFIAITCRCSSTLHPVERADSSGFCSKRFASTGDTTARPIFDKIPGGAKPAHLEISKHEKSLRGPCSALFGNDGSQRAVYQLAWRQQGRLQQVFAALFFFFFFFVSPPLTHACSQPGLPKSFLLDVATDNGEAPLDSPAGKSCLIEAKRKALTEEVFVEQSMLKVAPPCNVSCALFLLSIASSSCTGARLV